MRSLSDRIMEYAEALPEGALICPNALLHLGSRPAVYQALSRLTCKDKLRRVFQGVYIRTIETRFGRRSPGVDKVIPKLSELWGETIVPSGGAAANWLGLTDQVPIRRIYLTSGPDRQLQFATGSVDLRHAPRWQLAAPNQTAGNLVRALTFLSRQETEEVLGRVVPQLSDADLSELLAMRAILPEWIAKPLSAYVSHG